MRQVILLITTAILLSSCMEEHLYDKVGFDPGTTPNAPDPRINRAAPDYYYRSAPTVPQGYMPPPYYPQPYQGYAPSPYQQVPASRYYSNPYAMPQSPYQDVEQYYVTPNYYYGAETDQQPSGSGYRPAMRY